jgi:hypothetical protein
MVVTDTDVEWLLILPEAPVVGPMEAGDWLLPVDEFVAFAEERGFEREEFIEAVDLYAVAHGGLRVAARPPFHRFTNVARRLIGRCPVEPGEVWMFEHGNVTTLRSNAFEPPGHMGL